MIIMRHVRCVIFAVEYLSDCIPTFTVRFTRISSQSLIPACLHFVPGIQLLRHYHLNP